MHWVLIQRRISRKSQYLDGFQIYQKKFEVLLGIIHLNEQRSTFSHGNGAFRTDSFLAASKRFFKSRAYVWTICIRWSGSSNSCSYHSRCVVWYSHFTVQPAKIRAGVGRSQNYNEHREISVIHHGFFRSLASAFDVGFLFASNGEIMSSCSSLRSRG